MEKYKPIVTLGLGGILAVTLFFFPEAKPIACGVGFALPSMVL